MDTESSSKFIGSLSKFLQSLCNGYVNFEDGVELIGHIYLSVDTGKKIDYILNEKVCKSDNSVTFISNSFHAQPLDKLKTLSSKKNAEDKAPDGAGRKEEEALLLQSGDGPTRNTQINTLGRNHGSLSSGQATQNRSSVKRPGSPLTSRKAPTPPQRRPSTPPSQRRSQLQSASAKGSLGSPASLKNVPSSPSSSSLDNAPSPSSRLKTNHPSTETVSGDADSDILVPPNILAVAQVPDLSSFLGATGNEGQDATAHEQGLATSDDETKPDTDITFIKEEFIPSASSCAQAGSSGQSSGRSMEEQVHDSGSSSGLYPVMLHQNTAAFSSSGGFPPSFPSLGNATATSTSTSQASTDIFANPVPGTSNQDSSSGDPSGRQRARTCDTALAVCKRELYSSGAVHGNKSSFEFSPSTPRPFSSSFMLNLWQKKIMRPKLYVCSKCNQSFGYMGNLSRHRKASSRMMDSDWASSYITDLTCGIRGSHDGCCKGGATISYVPDEGSRMRNLRTMGQIIATLEEDIDDVQRAPHTCVQCKTCLYVFAELSLLHSHHNHCVGIKNSACNLCGRIYSSRFALKEHLLGKHGFGKQIVCPRCGKALRTMSRLYDHVCRQKHVDNDAVETLTPV
ncbi:fez family zinc finger protein erm-like isoform X8 [Pomacea canaliculata]|uniref:fez family zinc finger protein erm-like isoform X8 n=1 Tax=Pomacea canaliculata TaxID=400727 RepID=UPI000D73B391|nr:fez family zinc finger protein erm-like isoform X8 [Pomacea canaliculata]